MATALQSDSQTYDVGIGLVEVATHDVRYHRPCLHRGHCRTHHSERGGGLFNQVQQIRRYLDMVDRPTDLELGAAYGVTASTVGLPDSLDHVENGLVLFLSDGCGTCRSLAAPLAGGAIPPTLYVILEAEAGEAPSLIADFDLTGDRVFVDDNHRIAHQLRIDVFPFALRLVDGRIDSAQTIPTPRQLFAALPVVQARIPRAASTSATSVSPPQQM